MAGAVGPLVRPDPPDHDRRSQHARRGSGRLRHLDPGSSRCGEGPAKPVFIEWFPDMDTSSLAVSPASFVSAWRHVHDIFAARGATNAVWVWCPSAPGFASSTAQAYYPGDTYVDWACADGYNWAPRQ